ncbi:MAG: aminoacetone oxidase family FAD-binding enzyme, partial [Clostridia bacterium]|nr:aminoacetone oxidase family FAD-binding enzyme [Clostridia bacterium]
MERFDTDILIVGGGSAGLFLSAALAMGKCDVLLLEKNDRVGKKLCATGNGMGNISNADLSERYFHSSSSHTSMMQIIRGQTNSVYKFFNHIGVSFTKTQMGRIYPSSKQASVIVDLLLAKATSNPSFRMKTGTGVKSVSPKKNGYEVVTESGEIFTARCIVFTVGGSAGRGFCTDGSAYSLLRQLGHSLTPLSPSLVQLKTPTSFVKPCKGVKIDASIKLTSSSKEIISYTGDLLFCDYGVSGTAVFAISGYAAELLQQKKKAQLEIDMVPEIDSNALSERLKEICTYNGWLSTKDFLSGIINKQVYRTLLKTLKIKECPCGELTVQDIEKIVSALKCFSLDILDTTGFSQAQTTKGGIPLTEFDKNLQSKLAKNIYAAG